MYSFLFINLIMENDVIRKALQKRRRDGGCSAWKNIGLKWIYDNNRFDLLKYNWERDYINKHFRKLNEDNYVL